MELWFIMGGPISVIEAAFAVVGICAQAAGASAIMQAPIATISDFWFNMLENPF